MATKTVVIPTRTNYVFKTKYKQNPQTGLLEGREGPHSKPPYRNNLGDYTAVKVVTKPTDIDGDRKPDLFPGEIVGREKSGKGRTWVKGNSNQRAYLRR